jgi:hypothetical protein
MGRMCANPFLKRPSLRRERRPGHTELVRRSNNSTRGSADLVIDMDRRCFGFSSIADHLKTDDTTWAWAMKPLEVLPALPYGCANLDATFDDNAELKLTIAERKRASTRCRQRKKILVARSRERAQDQTLHVGRNVTVSHESNTSSEKSGDEKSVLGQHSTI